jgi:hypothetical protein
MSGPTALPIAYAIITIALVEMPKERASSQITSREKHFIARLVWPAVIDVTQARNTTNGAMKNT